MEHFAQWPEVLWALPIGFLAGLGWTVAADLWRRVRP